MQLNYYNFCAYNGGELIMEENKDLIIAVAGTGYVGLSIATLLS